MAKDVSDLMTKFLNLDSDPCDTKLNCPSSTLCSRFTTSFSGSSHRHTYAESYDWGEKQLSIKNSGHLKVVSNKFCTEETFSCKSCSTSGKISILESHVLRVAKQKNI